MSRLKILGLGLLTIALSGSLQAGFIQIAQPDAAYVGGTELFDISGIANFANVNSVTNSENTVTFSGTLSKRQVPGSWATWGAPPFTESATPHILFSSGSPLTLTLTNPAAVFGFEVEGNAFVLSTFTVQFFNGATMIGSVVQAVNGSAGARLFAGQATAGDVITSVVISDDGTAGGFSIAQLRGEAVPEPGTVTLLTAGLGLLGLARWRKKA